MGLDERATPQAKTGAPLAGATERFRHGFVQLVLAFQALHRDPLAWKRYLRVVALQSAVTVAVASLFVSTARSSSEGLREVRVRKAMEKVSAVHPKAEPHAERPATAPPPPAVPSPSPPGQPTAGSTTAAPSASADEEDEEDEDDEAQDKEEAAEKSHTEFQRDLLKLQSAILKLSKKAGPTAVRRDEDFQKARLGLDERLADLEQEAEKLPLTDEDRATLVRLSAELDVLERKTKPGWWDSAIALVLSIYGALSVVQAGVIALSRDYHAAIARDASLLLGVAPEDPPLAPRVHLNVAWIRRKFRQRTRSLLVFLPGVALISLVALFLPERALVTTVLTSLWAAYWWVVWTASKSARAWEREGVARWPWFLRLWHSYLAPLPLVGWMARAWEALWTRLSRSAFSPAEAVEAQPVEFAGLAAARALQLVPLVKLFVRPLVPVAAARLLSERTVRSERLLQSPAERASIAAQRAAVPASPSAIDRRDEM